MHSPSSRAPVSRGASARPGASLPPKRPTIERVGFGVALLLVALTAGGFAVLFRVALAFVLQHTSGSSGVVAAFTFAPAWARLLAPTAGGLAAGVIALALRKDAAGQGVSDAMEAVVLGRVRLSMRVTVAKSLASFFAIASGGSLGREGPIIQLGAATGKLVGSFAALSSRRRRTLIAAGTAAGFAAAYNTPFAAVLFVLEVVIGVVALDVIVPCLAATAIATALTRALVGPGPVYGQREFSSVATTELLAFAALGLLAALLARVFMLVVRAAESGFRRLSLTPPLRGALGGFGAGIGVLLVPEVAGNGYEPLNSLLDGTPAVAFVAVLVVAKMLATASSVASGSPGGVFTPTMLVGGAGGFLFHALLHRFTPLSLGPPGGFALVGMAAATAATTHAPLMAAVMAFELSGDYAVVLPLLVATALATALSRAMSRDSIYTAELRRRGVGWELTLEGRRMSDAREPPERE
jgi:CIC family chloride channel protein